MAGNKPDSSDEPRVKGLAFRSVVRAFASLEGEAARDQMFEVVGGEIGRSLAYGGLVASGWYPISDYRRIFWACRQVAGGGPELVRQIGREAIRSDLTGVHKILLGLLSPETVFSVAPRLFRGYYDHGSLAVLEKRKGFQRALWKDCSGFDENMWLEQVGSSDAILEQAGAEHIRLFVTRGGKNDDHMELEARYL